jgi:hypothetical protein
MKQQYKDMMIKFLEEHPGIEITSNPIGWWRTLQQVGKTVIDRRDSVYQTIKHGEIEPAIVALYVRDKVPSCTSYKFTYNSEEKAFTGKVKKRTEVNRPVSVEVKVPEDIWFDTADVTIRLKGKSSIECSVKLNVRNGMIPPRMKDAETMMESIISRQFREQLQGKGRVSQDTIRSTFNYSDVITISRTCDIIVHNNEDFTIKL